MLFMLFMSLTAFRRYIHTFSQSIFSVINTSASVQVDNSISYSWCGLTMYVAGFDKTRLPRTKLRKKI